MEDFSRYNGPGTELRKAQERMLDILVEIDAVCRRHDIPYWLDFGTLLGAVRHGGFIPWDDDLDVTVLRKDEKRLKEFLKKELPARFYVYAEDTSRNFDKVGYFRVVDRNSMILRPGQDESYLKREGNGLWVDVFNIEPGTRRFKEAVSGLHGKVLRRDRRHVDDGPVRRVVALLIYPFTKGLIGLYRMYARIGSGDRLVYNLENYVVRQLFSQRQADQIFPLSEICFEGHMFSCPGKSHELLTGTYGDYMAIPPEEKRVIHNVYIKTL
ncbi:MAG: LicD family protein [Bacteroidaceae bacterium]|nr:LicD family protein [Bacteroidaceae bacterium]